MREGRKRREREEFKIVIFTQSARMRKIILSALKRCENAMFEIESMTTIPREAFLYH